MVQNTGSMVISWGGSLKKRKSWEIRTVWSFSAKVNIADTKLVLGLEPTNQKSTGGNWNFPFTHSWSIGMCARLLLYFVLDFTQAGSTTHQSNARGLSNTNQEFYGRHTSPMHRHAQFLVEAHSLSLGSDHVFFFSLGNQLCLSKIARRFITEKGSPFPSNTSKTR